MEEPFAVRSVRGVVGFREHHGQPLEQVLFELQGPGSAETIRRATSDKKGAFEIGHVPQGDYKVKATLDGFSSIVGWINVSRKALKGTEIKIEIGIGN